MTTTTIRLPADLKTRVAAAATRAGTTAHGFILDAIAEKTTQTELQAAFQDQARQRQATLARTGMTVPWSAMRPYLEAKAAGKPATPPKARKLGR